MTGQDKNFQFSCMCMCVCLCIIKTFRTIKTYKYPFTTWWWSAAILLVMVAAPQARRRPYFRVVFMHVIKTECSMYLRSSKTWEKKKTFKLYTLTEKRCNFAGNSKVARNFSQPGKNKIIWNVENLKFLLFVCLLLSSARSFPFRVHHVRACIPLIKNFKHFETKRRFLQIALIKAKSTIIVVLPKMSSLAQCRLGKVKQRTPKSNKSFCKPYNNILNCLCAMHVNRKRQNRDRMCRKIKLPNEWAIKKTIAKIYDWKLGRCFRINQLYSE
jgi:hypothetical protein